MACFLIIQTVVGIVWAFLKLEKAKESGDERLRLRASTCPQLSFFLLSLGVCLAVSCVRLSIHTGSYRLTGLQPTRPNCCTT